jgi:carbon-monoxide dehydrogenase medium subunit
MRSRFVYLRPGSTSEAVAMQHTYGPDAKYLAGGTDLYLDWKNGFQVGYCIDVSHLRELDYLRLTDGVLHMGALTSLRTLEFNARSNYATDVLAKTATVMCTPQTRSLATVGGNLCNASPAADLAPPLLCMDATVSVIGANGPRTLALTELFTGVKQNSLDQSELLLDVAVPLRERARVVSLRATRTALDIALVIASVLVSVDSNDVIDTARIAFGAVSPTPLRVPRVEALLVGRRLDEIDEDFLQHVVTTAAGSTEPIDDVRTTAAYRKSVSATLLKRALISIVSDLRELEMAS